MDNISKSKFMNNFYNSAKNDDIMKYNIEKLGGLQSTLPGN